MNRPNDAIKVETTLKDFFANWLRYLEPLHGLSEKQIQLASAFLRVRYELSKKITDDELLDTTVLSTKVRKQIKEELGITTANFQVILGDLRRHGFIRGNRFVHKFIPKLDEDPKSYYMLLYFPIKEDNPNE